MNIKSSTENEYSFEYVNGNQKVPQQILKHMKTFGVTIYHILIQCIGSKLGLYVSFRIPLYVDFWQKIEPTFFLFILYLQKLIHMY